MSEIAINVRNPKETTSSALARLSDEVRRCAFSMCEARRCACHALDDWVEAERQLILRPALGIEDRGEEFRVSTTDVAEFEPSEIRLDVLPESIYILGQHGEGGQSREGRPRRSLVARVNLPSQIEPDSVRAELRHGCLEIVAKKAARAAARTAEPKQKAAA